MQIDLVETITLEDTMGDGSEYLGTVEVLGQLHHFQALKVETRYLDFGRDQWPVNDEFASAYEHLQNFYDGVYQTVKLPGVEGEYIIVMHPYAD